MRDSDATLVIRGGRAGSPGSDLTVATAAALGRPYLVACTAEAIIDWVGSLDSGMTLNVAGPRSSEEPGAYAAAFDLLCAVLGSAFRIRAGRYP